MKIKELAIQCGFQDDMETVGFMSCDYDQLQAFANTIIDRCVDELDSMGLHLTASELYALKDKE